MMFFFALMWYFEDGGAVLYRGWCGTLKRVVWYFEKGGVVHFVYDIRVVNDCLGI